MFWSGSSGRIGSGHSRISEAKHCFRSTRRLFGARREIWGQLGCHFLVYLPLFSMLTFPRRTLIQRLFRPAGARLFSIYEGPICVSFDAVLKSSYFCSGQTVQESELLPQEDDWVIEETNFCLGRCDGSQPLRLRWLPGRVQELLRALPGGGRSCQTCSPSNGLPIEQDAYQAEGW